MKTRFTKSAVSSLLLMGCALAAPAHDTWLVPAKYRVTAGEELNVAINTSMEFPTSDGAVTPDRMARFEIWTETDGMVPVEGYRVEGDSLVAAVTPGPGLSLIAAATKHRLIELEAEEFNQYISEEGLERVAKTRVEKGESGKLGRERYSKVTKLALCTPGGAVDRVSPVFGLQLEIVIATDVCTVRAGDTVPVQVLFDGKPLAGVWVAAGTEGTHGHEYPVKSKTDGEGRSEIRPPKAGPWYIRTLHMIPNRDFDDADWQSWFSTYTFLVRE